MNLLDISTGIRPMEIPRPDLESAQSKVPFRYSVHLGWSGSLFVPIGPSGSLFVPIGPSGSLFEKVNHLDISSGIRPMEIPRPDLESAQSEVPF